MEKKVLLVYVGRSADSHSWIDSCWTEEKQEEAIAYAKQIREETGYNTAVIAYYLNTPGCCEDVWNDDLQEVILDWED
jgi:hypothetical protein